MDYFFPTFSLFVIYALIFHSIFIAYFFILLSVLNICFERLFKKHKILFSETWTHIKKSIKLKAIIQLILFFVTVFMPSVKLGMLLHTNEMFLNIIRLFCVIAIVDAIFIMPTLLIIKRKTRFNEPVAVSFIVFDSIVWSMGILLFLSISA